MAVYMATTTFSSTGNDAHAITCGFPATEVTVTVAPASGVAAQGIEFCHGWTDLTRQKVDTLFDDGTDYYSEKKTNKLVRLVNGIDGMGNPIVAVEATLGTVNATQVKFNVTQANSNYQVSVCCRG